MNRAFTVWLSQSSSEVQVDGALSSSVAALPAFRLPALDPFGLTKSREVPLTASQVFARLLHYFWARRVKILALLALWRLVRKLRELSVSTHAALPGGAYRGPVDVTLFPQYIQSPSTGLWLFVRSWRVEATQERGIVFLSHAYRDHSGRFAPLVSALNSRGFSCYAMDHQGHGQSGGERGYVESFGHYARDLLAFVRETQQQISASGGEVKPCFILGHSMGATIALQAARVEEWRMAAEEAEREEAAAAAAAAAAASLGSRIKSAAPSVAAIAEDEEAWEREDEKSLGGAAASERSGVISLSGSSSSSSSSGASAASVAASSSPPAAAASAPRWRLNGLVLSSPALVPHSVSPLLQALATMLADILPKARPAPNVLDSSLLSGLTAVNAQWESDPLTIKDHAVPARWGHEMLAAMSDSRAEGGPLSELTLPVLIIQGTRDKYISPLGASAAYDALANCRDKSLRWIDATHDLWLDTAREEFDACVIQWLEKHTEQA